MAQHFQPFKLLARKTLTPTAALLRFEVPGGVALGGPGHVAPTGVKVLLPGTEIEKSYSPVGLPSDLGCFDLLVRAYPPRPGGGLGAYLCNLREGESALMKVKPRSFSNVGGVPWEPGRWKQLGLLACGTGLAPLIQVARQVLHSGDGTKVSLVMASRTEDEILMRNDLEDMAARYSSFSLHLQLSQPPKSWPEDASGRVTESTLKQYLPAPGVGAMVLICGTDGFVSDMAGPVLKEKGPDGKKKKLQGPLGGYLEKMGYSADMVHKF
eukprot:TRINITY_DN18808_c4_g1_i1.p1 TRINITY_DN18808_c4_g1~~TRINITY_DN18808_c4_g1_i1.p1  ORF type:complete len:285 (-),score=54.54 TRINITY_DN18808_c4_g1_i1:152-955(-)